MEKTNKYKLLLVLISALILASVTLICASAEATPVVQTTARVTAVNIVQNDKFNLAFEVTPTVVMPEGGVAGLAIWEVGEENPTIENCKYVNFNEKSGGGKKYIKTREIALSDIGKEFYVSACYKLGDKIMIAETPFKYSLAKYLTKRLSETVTEDQTKIYSTLLELGISLSGSEEGITAVKAIGGYVGSSTATVGGVLGQTVLLRADAKNGEGKYFIGWANEAGEIISTSRLYTVRIENVGITTYTAKYGDARDSLYSATYDFEAISNERMKFTIPSQYTMYDRTGYDSKKTPCWSIKNNNNPGLSISGVIEAVAVGDDEYVYGRRDNFVLKEDSSGDKSIYIERGHQIVGYTLSFSNTFDESYAYGAEVDIQFHTVNLSGIGHHVNLVLKDANGNTLTLRNNLSYSTSEGVFKILSEAASNKDRVAAPEVLPFSAGCIFTFRAELDRERCALKFYANDRYLGDISLEDYGSYASRNEDFDLSTACVSTVSLSAISSAKDHISVDNVTFIKGEAPVVPDVEEDGE